jgi:SIR2-like domain
VCGILTTNFDFLIENALHEAGIEPTVIASEDALAGATPLIHARCIVIKLHGDYLDTRIKNTDAELGGYAPAIDAILDEVLDTRASRGRLVGRVGHGTSGCAAACPKSPVLVLLGRTRADRSLSAGSDRPSWRTQLRDYGRR